MVEKLGPVWAAYARYRMMCDQAWTQSPENERIAWSRISECLHAYAHRRNWVTPGTPLSAPRFTQPIECLPAQLALWLAALIDELVAGKIPGAINKMRRRGAPSAGFAERRAIMIAACYVKAAREKRIQDRAPVKTIRKEYGISPRTASDWLKIYPNVSVDDLWPGALLVPDFAPRMRMQIKESGRIYREFGGGRIGVLHRRAKHRKSESGT